MAQMGAAEDRKTMEEIFWHYVKGQTKMFTDKEFAQKTNATLNMTYLESLMAKIGWNENTTFPKLAHITILPSTFKILILKRDNFYQ